MKVILIFLSSNLFHFSLCQKTIPPKIISPTLVKSLKRSTAVGAAIGTSIPAIKELTTTIPSNINNFKTKFESIKNIKNDIDLVNPSEFTTKLQSKGEIWSYSKLLTDMNPNDIYGVSIHQDGKFALIVENTHSHNILPENIHYVTTMPIHVSELIDLLLQSNIHFDILAN